AMAMRIATICSVFICTADALMPKNTAIGTSAASTSFATYRMPSAVGERKPACMSFMRKPSRSPSLLGSNRPHTPEALDVTALVDDAITLVSDCSAFSRRRIGLSSDENAATPAHASDTQATATAPVKIQIEESTQSPLKP